MKTKIEVYKIEKRGIVQYPKKVGIDSDTVINILNDKWLFAPLLRNLSNEKGLLYIHQESIREIPEVLHKKYDWSLDDAKRELKKLKQDYSIETVPKNPQNPHLAILKEGCKKNNVFIHPPDSWIVADFKEFGINKVYSGTRHVIEACKLMGLDVFKTPTPDRKISDELRKIFRQSKFVRK